MQTVHHIHIAILQRIRPTFFGEVVFDLADGGKHIGFQLLQRVACTIDTFTVSL